MARSRKDPDVVAHPIPDDWAEFIGSLADEPAYQAAWAYAASMGNPHKACYVFADNKWQEFSDGGDYARPEEKTAAMIQEDIDRLMAQKKRLETEANAS